MWHISTLLDFTQVPHSSMHHATFVFETVIPPRRDENFRQGGTGFVLALFLSKTQKQRIFWQTLYNYCYAFVITGLIFFAIPFYNLHSLLFHYDFHHVM